MQFTSKAGSGLHPELGYLCPTGRLRAGIRVLATLTTTALLLGAALLLFKLADRTADASDRMVVAAIDAQTDGGSAAELQSDWNVFDTARAPATRQQDTCVEFARAFLETTCRSNPARRRHAGRVVHKPMTVVIGHADGSVPDGDAGGAQEIASAPAPTAIPLPVARPLASPPKPAIAQARGQKPVRLEAPVDAVAANDQRTPSEQTRSTPFGFPFGGLFGPH